MNTNKENNILIANSNGEFPADLPFPKLHPPWEQAVEDFKITCKHAFNKKLHSIYIRGSVALGNPLSGISDLDGIVVLKEISPEARLECEKIKKHILKSYPEITRVEAQIIPLDKILSGFEYASLRFFLKHLSICVEGKDLRTEIQKFKANRNIGFLLHRNIQEEIKQSIDYLKQTLTKEQENECRIWILKRILRTSMCLVLEKEKVYTRDLFTCFDLFSKNYPEKKEIMKQALDFTLSPPSKEHLIKFLEKVEPFLTSEVQKQFYAT